MLTSVIGPRQCAYGNDDSFSEAKEAQYIIGESFLIIMQAEEAGANVSDLLIKLNEASKLLTEAKIAYAEGLQYEAALKADRCSEMAFGVLNEAVNVRSTTLAIIEEKRRTTIVLSSVGALAFVILLLAAWSWVKRSYVRKLLKMKPEV